MRTIISNDHIGRFAELDHSVLEEIQAIMEARGRPAPASCERASEVESGETEPRHVTWMKAALNVFS